MIYVKFFSYNNIKDEDNILNNVNNEPFLFVFMAPITTRLTVVSRSHFFFNINFKILVFTYFVLFFYRYIFYQMGLPYLRVGDFFVVYNHYV